MKMKKLKKVVLIVVGVGLVAGIGVQFVPVPGVGNNPPQRYALNASPQVDAILRKACLDCHSNETRWPWYSRVFPTSWLIMRDVRRGRSRMNVSEWGDTDEDERNTDKENSWDKIEAGEMPPSVYLPMHPDARLSDEEKQILKGWLLAHKNAAAEKPAAEKPAAADKAPTTGDAGTATK